MPSGTIAVILCSLLLARCGWFREPLAQPSIEFTKLPAYGIGNPVQLDAIEGRATGVQAGQRIVLYARSGLWWLQPAQNHPFTEVQSDSKWRSHTHPGSAYAALLVRAGYNPQWITEVLPKKGGAVLAVATVERPKPPYFTGKTVTFDGYDWQIRQTPDYPFGARNDYDPANVWIDPRGLLHLRIAAQSNRLTSAEVNLPRSLGYGTYRFVVNGLSQMAPEAVFTISTTDDEDSFREMDIEISPWGGTTKRNGQFVLQPYYVPANTIQFQTPGGTATFMLRWEPGRASLKVFAGRIAGWEEKAAASHVFTSSVPAAGNESVHMNLYVASNKSDLSRHGTEVMVEKFDYLP